MTHPTHCTAQQDVIQLLAVAKMYVQGVSTRKVLEITRQLCGLEVSSTQVSRVAKLLDEESES